MVDNNKILTERIMDVAEKLFAEKGFSETTVRDLTRIVGCNVAAINYYFRGKDKLYLNVFRRRIKIILETRNGIHSDENKPKKEQVGLEVLTQSFVNLLLTPFPNGRTENSLAELFMREKYDSHLPKDIFYNEVVSPIKNIMLEDLLEVCPKLNPVDAEMCVYFIMGLLIDLVRSQKIFKEFSGKTIPWLNMEKGISCILKFSIGGIYAIADNSSSEKIYEGGNNTSVSNRKIL